MFCVIVDALVSLIFVLCGIATATSVSGRKLSGSSAVGVHV